MSSLKSAALLSLFTGVSFADLWRPASYRRKWGYAKYPPLAEMAHATRFAAPSQVVAVNANDVERRALDVARSRLAA